MDKPNILYETIMSVIKWFILFIVINNLIWFLVVYNLVNGTNASISQTQDGENNFQELIENG